ncbi:EamA family transporter [Nocardioides marmorisolisilvae]|uniref:EamA family transporter n=1 Tax=Nocardioides marmorisolisilvae TaxID=1542737 RepID=A0A3N0DQ32_9ACTN|nr:EamA family transporter [Nocardioides marmorisolisilvae]RNL77752.1 EamA family transporter [Nocardioides marmorisolisilvae]
MRSRSSALGVGLVVLGASCFIVNAGVSRVALRHGVDPSMLTTIRVTMTFAVLLVVAALFRRSALRPPSGRLLGLVVAHGLIGVAALQWTYFVAIDRLPVGMALLLEYQAPILVALWARFVQKEQVSSRLWFGLVLAVVGLAAATEVWNGTKFDGLGVVAGLAAAVCFAGYFLIGEAGVSQYDPLRMILWSFLVAAVALNAVNPLTGFDTGLLDDRVSLLGHLSEHRVPLWLVLTWVVVLGTVVPFFAELFALSFVRATTVTVIAMMEPIGVSALGWAWFGESLGVVAVIGCVAVVAGILLAQAARLDHDEPPLIT